MGATVTTGKLAAAFKAAGKIVYVLFEETYEKNCTPHNPHWSCFLIGTLEEAVERIFLHADACEGGMLQNRNGHITPEGYIAGWMKELAVPVEMPDGKVVLSVGNGIYAPIPENKIDDSKRRLVEIGRQDIADAIQPQSSISLSLHTDAAIILALYGPKRLSPWKILDGFSAPTDRDRNASLGYAPKPAAKFDVQPPKALKIDADNRLLQRPDGSWYCAGWQYSVVGTYIKNLWEAELREPGSYRKRIQSYRDALTAAAMIQPGAKVVVNTTLPMEDYQRSLIERFSKEHPVTITPTGFEVELTNDRSNIYLLTQFSPACATWIVQEANMSA